MFDLTGKCALVTGASGGIGAAIARHMYACGASVALSGTRWEALESLAHELGERAYVVPADLSDAEAVASLVPAAETQMGGVDILINNAGLTRDNLAIRLKNEDWDRVLHVNLTSSFQLARACLKGMMKRRHGRIISITSVVGVTGNVGQVNYAASKAGLIGMSKSLAAEVAARGITVNCVAPGFVGTAMTDALSDSQKDEIKQAIPSRQMGKVDDIAAAVVYLASSEAGYVTGQTVHVNGGLAMV